MRAEKSFPLTEKLGRVFIPSVSWHSAWLGGPMQRCSSRCVTFAAHVKSCERWGRFFVNGEIWPGFPYSVLVGVDTLGPTVYSTMWLSFPWATSWGGCCGGYLGTIRAFPVGGLQAGKRGQGGVNPGKTCLPAYSGESVRRKTSLLLGSRVLGRYSDVKS